MIEDGMIPIWAATTSSTLKACNVYATRLDTKGLMEEVLTYQMWEMNK